MHNETFINSCSLGNLKCFVGSNNPLNLSNSKYVLVSFVMGGERKENNAEGKEIKLAFLSEA